MYKNGVDVGALTILLDKIFGQFELPRDPQIRMSNFEVNIDDDLMLEYCR